MKVYIQVLPRQYFTKELPDNIDPENTEILDRFEEAVRLQYPQAQVFLVETKDKITATCLCCGIKKDFENGEAAFHAGWDTPPHFTGYASCDLCPGSFIVMGHTHKHEADHQRWKVSGRPETFTAPKDAEGNPI